MRTRRNLALGAIAALAAPAGTIPVSGQVSCADYANSAASGSAMLGPTKRRIPC